MPHLKCRRTIVLGTFGVLIHKPARADLYDDYINSASRRPFVAFLARTSGNVLNKPGHSYVGVGVELDNGFLVYERLYGYYPTSETAYEEIKAVFSKVSGNLKSKIEDVAWKLEYRLSITDEQRSKALSVVERWSSNDPKYNLFANGGKNCSSFASDVAQAVGLKIPSGPGSKFPINFMTELKDINTK